MKNAWRHKVDLEYISVALEEQKKWGWLAVHSVEKADQGALGDSSTRLVFAFASPTDPSVETNRNGESSNVVQPLLPPSAAACFSGAQKCSRLPRGGERRTRVSGRDRGAVSKIENSGMRVAAVAHN